MRSRVALWLLLLLPVSSFANGAMGLGLEIFDLRSWFAYVAVMILIEACWLGRWLNVGIWSSLGVAVVANVVTGSLCSVMNFAAPFFHPNLGLDPNPLLYSIKVLVACAFPSALAEAVFWDRVASKQSPKGLLTKVVAVHLATLPVALAILLIPERPYVGLEGLIGAQRRYELLDVGHRIEDYVGETRRLPKFESTRELMDGLDISVSELAFYAPSYRRFSTRDDRDRPWVINASASGRALTESEKEEWIWIAHRPGEPDYGMFLDLSSGQVVVSRRPR